MTVTEARRRKAELHAQVAALAQEELPKRVLLIEDDPATRRLIASYMPGSVTLDEAATPAEALALLEQHYYDLILLDQSLPGGRSAREVYDAIREVSAARVAVVSGSEPEIDTGAYVPKLALNKIAEVI